MEMHRVAGGNRFKARNPLRRNTHDSEKIGYKSWIERGSSAGIAAKYFEIIEERSSERTQNGAQAGERG
jgi:hypothetical protein